MGRWEATGLVRDGGKHREDDFGDDIKTEEKCGVILKGMRSRNI